MGGGNQVLGQVEWRAQRRKLLFAHVTLSVALHLWHTVYIYLVGLLFMCVLSIAGNIMASVRPEIFRNYGYNFY